MHVSSMMGNVVTGYPYSIQQKPSADAVQPEEPETAAPETVSETAAVPEPAAQTPAKDMLKELSIYSQLTQMLQNLSIDYEAIGWVDEDGNVQRSYEDLYDFQESA